MIKVPVLNAWCGVPLRAAAATSAFMIGVTATPGAIIYYGRGQLDAGAGGRRGARRAARVVARAAVWRRGAGEVAEAADGGRPRHRGDPDVRRGRDDAEPASSASSASSCARASWSAPSCLGVGLVLSFLGTGPIALIVLDIGVIVLLATPVVRVVVSIVEYTSGRDWAFVGLTAIVLVELAASAVAALAVQSAIVRRVPLKLRRTRQGLGDGGQGRVASRG